MALTRSGRAKLITKSLRFVMRGRACEILAARFSGRVCREIVEGVNL